VPLTKKKGSSANRARRMALESIGVMIQAASGAGNVFQPRKCGSNVALRQRACRVPRQVHCSMPLANPPLPRPHRVQVAP